MKVYPAWAFEGFGVGLAFGPALVWRALTIAASPG
ncbi:UNVERIFIED_ORG: hypothetical protein FHR35_006981 [Microbispora rosea subsp. rosea]